MTDIELEAVLQVYDGQLAELKAAVKFLQSELEKAFKKMGFPHNFGAEPEPQPTPYDYWDTVRTVPQGIQTWVNSGKIKIDGEIAWRTD